MFVRQTSKNVFDAMFNKLDVNKLRKSGTYILEPSAGDGTGLLDRLISELDIQPKEIDCIELNEEKRKILKEKGYYILGADFLKVNSFPDRYDLIFAAPPFKGNVDLIHIRKMYNVLRNTGQIITLTSPQWITNNETHHIEFRKWLEDKHYSFTMLPDNSFMEKNKSVPTGILKIEKETDV